MELIEDVKGVLEEADYTYSEYAGCFDIVASRKGRFSPLLLKVLSNIDSLQFSQANNLKILSKNLSASAMVIGLKTRREALDDNTVYERFEITALNPKTLENILLRQEMPGMYRFRGGLFAEIDEEELRNARLKKGLSQRELADRIGITKKNVYEHEKKRMRMDYGTAKKLERFLGSGLLIDVTLDEPAPTERNNLTVFEKRVSNDLKKLGFQTDIIRQAPFNIIAKEHFMLFSDAAEIKDIEKDAPYLEGFSKIVKTPVVAITKEDANLDLPTIGEKELHEITSAKELKRMIKKR